MSAEFLKPLFAFWVVLSIKTAPMQISPNRTGCSGGSRQSQPHSEVKLKGMESENVKGGECGGWSRGAGKRTMQRPCLISPRLIRSSEGTTFMCMKVHTDINARKCTENGSSEIITLLFSQQWYQTKFPTTMSLCNLFYCCSVYLKNMDIVATSQKILE